MSQARRNLILTLVVALIAGVIFFLELQKPTRLTPGETDVRTADLTDRAAGKASRYSPAKEISTPDGFINSEPFLLADLIGQKVILIDFWTYSCINCQRTTPFLNEWYKKYADDGLVIIGIHTPEFEFEKDFDNVAQAIQAMGIRYPVVLDNDFSTWAAYENRYWPHKYLIDIDGYIVYDHIGEGGYEETELAIREALAERADVLNEKIWTEFNGLAGDDTTVNFHQVNSPEIYFGSGRNKDLANGESYQSGQQTLTAPTSPELNRLYLDGEWEFEEEFARNNSAQAKVPFRFSAKNVYMVLGADQPTTVTVMLDGQRVTADSAGADVTNGQMTVDEERLYQLISLDDYGEHTLEIIIEQPGLKAFTFTFG